jgi:hypothetical protein
MKRRAHCASAPGLHLGTADAFPGDLWCPLLTGEEPSPAVLLLVSTASPCAASSAPSAPSCGLGVSWGAPFPPLHSPALPPGSFPWSQGRTPTACGRGRVAARPLPALGRPRLPPGEHQVDLAPHALPAAAGGMRPCGASTPQGRLDRLTAPARAVRGHVARRARHASGASPWHASAQPPIWAACFCRMTPFRRMLLTLQSGPQRFTPRAPSVPAYAQVLRHSSIALARRTRVSWEPKRLRMWRAARALIACCSTT